MTFTEVLIVVSLLSGQPEVDIKPLASHERCESKVLDVRSNLRIAAAEFGTEYGQEAAKILEGSFLFRCESIADYSEESKEEIRAIATQLLRTCLRSLLIFR